MPAIPYLTGGESPSAARLNTLFEEADRRLTLALADHSLVWWAGRDPFLCAPYFFIHPSLPEADAYRAVLYRAQWAAHGAGISHDQTVFQPLVDACPLVAGYEDAVLHARMLDDQAGSGLSALFTPLGASLTAQGHEWRVNPITRSLAALKQDGWNLFTRLGTSQCSLARAQIDVVFAGYTAFTWEAGWDRFNCFRFHNTSSAALTITFADHSIVIPAHGSRCTRRIVSALGTQWVDGWNHFQRAVPGDPRYWDGRRPSTAALAPADTCYTRHNLTAPSILLSLFSALDVNGFAAQPYPTIFGAEAPGGHMVFDEREMGNPGTFDGRYGVADSPAPLADALISRGDVALVTSPASAAASTKALIPFDGASDLSAFTASASAAGLVIMANEDGSLTLSAASSGNVDVWSLGSNLVWAALRPYCGRALASASVGPDDGDCGLSGGNVVQRNGTVSNFSTYANATVGALNISFLGPTLNAYKSFQPPVTTLQATIHANYGDWGWVSGAAKEGAAHVAVGDWNPGAGGPPGHLHTVWSRRVEVLAEDPVLGIGLFTTSLASLRSRFLAPAGDLFMTPFGPMLAWDGLIPVPDVPVASSLNPAPSDYNGLLAVLRKGEGFTLAQGIRLPLLYHFGEKYFPPLAASWELLLDSEAQFYLRPAVLPPFEYQYAGKPRAFTARPTAALEIPMGGDAASLPPAWHHVAHRNRAVFTDDQLRRFGASRVPGLDMTGAIDCWGLAYWLAGQAGPFDGVRPEYLEIPNPTPGDAGVLTAEELYELIYGPPAPPGLPALHYSKAPGTGSPSWYRKMRAATLANTGRDISSVLPVAQPTDGDLWIKDISGGLVPGGGVGDRHLPLDRAHYNALASVVNACVRVRPLSLLDFGLPVDASPSGAYPVPRHAVATYASEAAVPDWIAEAAPDAVKSLADAQIADLLDNPVSAGTPFASRTHTYRHQMQYPDGLYTTIAGSYAETIPAHSVELISTAEGAEAVMPELAVLTHPWWVDWRELDGLWDLAAPMVQVGTAERPRVADIEEAIPAGSIRLGGSWPNDPLGNPLPESFTPSGYREGTHGARFLLRFAETDAERVLWVGAAREYLVPESTFTPGWRSLALPGGDILVNRLAQRVGDVPNYGGGEFTFPVHVPYGTDSDIYIFPFEPDAVGDFAGWTGAGYTAPSRGETGGRGQPVGQPRCSAMYVAARHCTITAVRYPAQRIDRALPTDPADNTRFAYYTGGGGEGALPITLTPADPAALAAPVAETLAAPESVLTSTGCDRLRFFVDLTVPVV